MFGIQNVIFGRLMQRIKIPNFHCCALQEKISRDVKLLTQQEVSVKNDIEQLEDMIQQTEV